MKILISTESYYPNISGVSIFSHNLAQKMVQRGHQVFVVAPSPKFTAYEETIDGIKIFRLSSKKNTFRDGYYISKKPFGRLKKIINEVEPDVVHLQDPAMISLATLLQSRRKKIPIVVTNHFSLEYIITYLPLLKPVHFLILFFFSKYLAWFYGKCQILTCPTKTVAEQFSNYKLKNKIEVISNGVDLSRFMPAYGDIDLFKRSLKISENRPVALYVGRMDIDKNLNVLIQAFAEVVKEIDAQLLLVGSGREKKDLQKLVEDLKIKKSVTFLDFVPYENKKLPTIYQSADLFINPCPMETQSIVVLEAQATGLPIVVANSGALPELVDDGINGYRFKPGDKDDLADKIVKILSNKKMAKKMGEKSLEKVETHLVNDTYNRYEEIYLKLVENEKN